MRVGLVGIGIVIGWLVSKTWNDPGCQLGLIVFLIATAVMTPRASGPNAPGGPLSLYRF